LNNLGPGKIEVGIMGRNNLILGYGVPQFVDISYSPFDDRIGKNWTAGMIGRRQLRMLVKAIPFLI
jgi:hypothetical protein